MGLNGYTQIPVVRGTVCGEKADRMTLGVFMGWLHLPLEITLWAFMEEPILQPGEEYMVMPQAAVAQNFGVSGHSYSTSSTASGVYGYNNRTSGTTRGVQGVVQSGSGFGVVGALDPSGSSSGAGVYGLNNASSGSGVGVEGYNGSSSGWAGNFTSLGNGVTVSAASGKTGLVVSGGSKSAAVATSDGDRLLYHEESTEILFTDYGFGSLQDGLFTII